MESGVAGMAVRRLIMVLLLAGAGLQAGLAHGQTVPALRRTIEDPLPPSGLAADPNLLVQDRPLPRRKRAAEDPYAPRGLGLGGLRFYPSIAFAALANSNPASSPNDAQRDIGLNIRPGLRVESDWVRHALSLGASGDFTFYGGNSDLDSQDLDVFQRLRLDVRRDTTAVLDTSYARQQTGLESSDVPASAVGFRTDHTSAATVGLTHAFGSFDTKLKTGATFRSFDDVKLLGGGVESNADRAYIEPILSLRATYTDPPMIKPFVEAGYTPRLHRQSIDRNGIRRDSHGFGLTAGLMLDDGPIWSGDVGLTYLHRNYDDPALDSNQALGLTGELIWSPTDLTRVVLSLGTTLSETATAGSPGSRNWNMKVAASHSLSDSIAFTVGSGAAIEEGSGGTDVTYDASAAVSWKLNPMLAWTAGYDVTWLDADAAGRDYVVHRVSTGLTVSR